MKSLARRSARLIASIAHAAGTARPCRVHPRVPLVVSGVFALAATSGSEPVSGPSALQISILVILSAVSGSLTVIAKFSVVGLFNVEPMIAPFTV